MTRSSTSRRYLKPVALAAAAALIAGVGAFAAFTDTERVNRSVDAGQLDIMASPGQMSVSNFAPGDWMARGIAIDIHSDYNDGNLIEAIDLDLSESWFDACAEVNEGQPIGPNGDPYVCENPDAHLLDGNALGMAILSCPQGQIHDGQPTVDDDDDPNTDSRFDGPGPHTCVVNGDNVPFVVVDEYTNIDPSYRRTLTPDQVGALMVDTGRTVTWVDPEDPSYSEDYLLRTFADGQTLELLTCIRMDDDIWGYTEADGFHDVEDNDYENLSADIAFTWSAQQRPGLAQVVDGQAGPAMSNWYTDGCNGDIWWEDDPGDDPDPLDPDDFFGGDNTIEGIIWDDSTPADLAGDGQYDPNSYDQPSDISVSLWAPDTSQPGSPWNFITSMQPDADGWYRFEGLVDGDYQINAGHLQGWWGPTVPNVGDDATDSDLLPGGFAHLNGGYMNFTLAGGQVKQLDAGFVWTGVGGF